MAGPELKLDEAKDNNEVIVASSPGLLYRVPCKRLPHVLAAGEPCRPYQDKRERRIVILEDPKAYQYIFQKVEKALFVRQGLEASPQK